MSLLVRYLFFILKIWVFPYISLINQVSNVQPDRFWRRCLLNFMFFMCIFSFMCFVQVSDNLWYIMLNRWTPVSEKVHNSSSDIFISQSLLINNWLIQKISMWFPVSSLQLKEILFTFLLCGIFSYKHFNGLGNVIFISILYLVHLIFLNRI